MTPQGPTLSPRRQRQLLAFLASLGLEEPTGPSGLAPIDEALTHTSAGLAHNHERLEFLGDAVLRLAASEHLQRLHPQLSVGARAELRAQIVSDRWLAELGERCGIDAVVRLGAMAAGDAAARPTIRAEACEALIGALYEAWGTLEPVHGWLSPHWSESIAALLADPHRHNWKQALQEWTQARGLGLPVYRGEECSQLHGDPRRFHSSVAVATSATADPLGEGWGRSRREAEQQAASAALEALEQGANELRPAPGC